MYVSRSAANLREPLSSHRSTPAACSHFNLALIHAGFFLQSNTAEIIITLDFIV